jgi:glycosyltransferase involved in cell wall biosynthesis
LVSNPVLHRMYGGYLVPHVSDILPAHLGTSDSPGFLVAFVGTPKAHKGIECLRRGVEMATSHRDDIRLVVTGSKPPDAKHHEIWLGPVSTDIATLMVQTADAIAIPSLPRSYGQAQLPIKLVDAMASARPIIASDLEPIRWALADAGILVPPGSHSAIADALCRLARDKGLAQELGFRARSAFAARFTPERVAPILASAIEAQL